LHIARVVESFWFASSPVTRARDQTWVSSAGLAQTDPLLVLWDGEGLGAAIAEDEKTGRFHLAKYENRNGHENPKTTHHPAKPLCGYQEPRKKPVDTREESSGWTAGHNRIRPRNGTTATHADPGAKTYIKRMSAGPIRSVSDSGHTENLKNGAGQTSGSCIFDSRECL
jgi:hypothetical protein